MIFIMISVNKLHYYYYYYYYYVITVWSTPECIRGEVLTTMHYTNWCLPLPYIIDLISYYIIGDYHLIGCKMQASGPK